MHNFPHWKQNLLALIIRENVLIFSSIRNTRTRILRNDSTTTYQHRLNFRLPLVCSHLPFVSPNQESSLTRSNKIRVQSYKITEAVTDRGSCALAVNWSSVVEFLLTSNLLWKLRYSNVINSIRFDSLSTYYYVDTREREREKKKERTRTEWKFFQMENIGLRSKGDENARGRTWVTGVDGETTYLLAYLVIIAMMWGNGG